MSKYNIDNGETPIFGLLGLPVVIDNDPLKHDRPR